MRSLFCKRCESLNFPGADSCRMCGSRLDKDSIGPQSAITGFSDTIDEETEEMNYVFAESENVEAPYLPYVPRPMQLTIISDIRGCLDSSKHMVMESGTGTGKTIVALASALEHAIPKKKGSVSY